MLGCANCSHEIPLQENQQQAHFEKKTSTLTWCRLLQNDLLSLHHHKTLNIVAYSKWELHCSQCWQPKGYSDRCSNVLSVPKATSHLCPLEKSIFEKRKNRADRYPLSPVACLLPHHKPQSPLAWWPVLQTLSELLPEALVFKSPVQSGFFAPFGRTATVTGCLLW